MNITEVRVRLAEVGEKCRAFVTIVLDDELVLKGLKIIERKDGRIFVAMPDRRIADNCGKCGAKTFVVSKFCHLCGTKLESNRVTRRTDGRFHLRFEMERVILRAYLEEKDRPAAVRCSWLEDMDEVEFLELSA